MNKILKTNLKLAHKEDIGAKLILKNSGYMIGTFASLPYILKEWNIKLIGEEHLKNTRGSAVIFSAHIGQIWLAAVACHLCKQEFYHSYRTINFNGIHDIFETIYKKSSDYFLGSIAENDARGFIRALKADKKVVILADQHSNGIDVPFFYKHAKFGTGAAKLAFKFNCPLIPVSGFLSGKKSYTIVIEKPIYCSNYLNVFDLTKQIALKTQTWINDHPDQYWWLIKRWQRKYYD